MNMKKSSKSLKTAVENRDYILDVSTRRSCFQSNNKAALIHGGYSKSIPEELITAVLDNDLGFELGVLKGQLSNISTMGMGIISDLLQSGESTTALDVALSCADRSAKLVPQIQKILESEVMREKQQDPRLLKSRSRLLKKLHAGLCLPSDVAYQFEYQQLGELPDYVTQMLKLELKESKAELETELYSREELQSKIAEYWLEVEQEKQSLIERKVQVVAGKDRVNRQLFSAQQSDEKGSED